MDNPLIRRLEWGASLTEPDRQQLRDATRLGETIIAGQDVVREGEAIDGMPVVMSGLVCRYKSLPDGRRSIMAYLIPGDICDPHGDVLAEMDHGIAALSN